MSRYSQADESAFGTIIALFRDIAQSGGKIPPLFSKLVDIWGTWIESSKLLGERMVQLYTVMQLAHADSVAARSRTNASGNLYGSWAARAQASHLRELRRYGGMNEAALIEAQRAYNLSYSTNTGLHRRDRRNEAMRAARDAYSRHGNAHLTGDDLRQFNLSAGQVSNSAAFGSFVRGGSIMRMGTSLVGGPWGAFALGLLATLRIGTEFYERFAKKERGALQTRLAQMKLYNSLSIMGVQQRAQLEEQHFKNLEEMDRKRLENTQKLISMRAKSDQASIAMQERLLGLDQERLRAQKQMETFKTNAIQLEERLKTIREHNKEEARTADTMKRSQGMIATMYNIGSLFGISNVSLEDERGRAASESLASAVSKFRIPYRRQHALEEYLQMGSMSRDRVDAAVDASIDAIVGRYKTIMENMASLTTGFGGAAMAAKIADYTKTFGQYETLLQDHSMLRAGELYRRSYSENVASGALKVNERGESAFYDEHGQLQVIRGAAEFESHRQTESALNAQNLAGRKDALGNVLTTLGRALEQEYALRQGYINLMQEQVRQQTELVHKIREATKQDYEAERTGWFGEGNRKSQQELEADIIKKTNLARLNLKLSQGIYAVDADAAEQERMLQTSENDKVEYEKTLAAKQRSEETALYKKYMLDSHNVRLQYEREEHASIERTTTKLYKAFMDMAKAQQEVYYKLQQSALTREVTASTSLGKTQTDYFQEMQLSRIADFFEERKALFTANYDVERAAADEEFELASAASEKEFKENQLIERNQAEAEAIRQQFELEKELALEEHVFRIELAKREFEFRKKMSELDATNNRRSSVMLDKLVREGSTLDEDTREVLRNSPKQWKESEPLRYAIEQQAQAMFDGKNYSELSADDKTELFNSLANGVLADVYAAAERSQKRLSDYRDSNGNELSGVALLRAVEADLRKRYAESSPQYRSTTEGEFDRDLLESLSSGLAQEIMSAYKGNQDAYTAENKKYIDELDGVRQSIARRLEGIYQRGIDNTINTESKKAEIENNQQIQLDAYKQQAERAKMVHDTSWDMYKQNGLRQLDLRQKEEEEGFKIGVRQIARHEASATEAFTARLNASDGNGFTAAVLRERNEARFNNARDELEDRQAAERRELRARGGTERDMMKLQARHELEAQNLENQKKVADAMIQRRVGSETGSTTDALSMWEQIQQSAFGHTADPVVSALESLTEQQKDQNARMLEAQLGQYDRLSDEVSLSEVIARNTAELVTEARKDKGRGKSTTIVNPPGGGLTERPENIKDVTRPKFMDSGSMMA